MKDPAINPRSEKLAQKKNVSKLKVEDRLMKIGRLWKDKKELQQKSYLKEIENRA